MSEVNLGGETVNFNRRKNRSSDPLGMFSTTQAGVSVFNANVYTSAGTDAEISNAMGTLRLEVAESTELGNQRLEERSAELRDRVSETGSAIEPTRDKVQMLEETVARQQETIDTLQAQVALLVQRLEAVEGTEN